MTEDKNKKTKCCSPKGDCAEGACSTDKGSNCPISKCCKKMKLTCFLKLGAFVIFVFHVVMAVYAVKTVDYGTVFNFISVLGGQLVTAIFQPLILLALAKMIDYKESSCSTKECS